jgi:hypothetical protein
MKYLVAQRRCDYHAGHCAQEQRPIDFDQDYVSMAAKKLNASRITDETLKRRFGNDIRAVPQGGHHVAPLRTAKSKK